MQKLISAFALCAVLASCGGGGGSSGASPTPSPAPGPAPTPTPAPPPPVSGCSAGVATTISGSITFDNVPVAISGGSARLNYAAIAQTPARGVTVEAIDASSLAVLTSTTTNGSGIYSVSLPATAASRSVFIRAKARIQAVNGASADIAVIDNTNNGAQWATDSTSFCTSTAAIAKNLNAGSGWTGTAYNDAQRAAGPFAILDTLYTAALKINSVDATATFPTLRVNWSPNNVASNGSLALGQIGTSFYSTTGGSTPSRNLYILGKADNDTDEYDDHVVAHEFGHYLQDVFSRDDTIGGTHGGTNDRLDMRVAFSEGWGNGWSGIALNNPVYADTSGPGQQSGGNFNVSVGEATNPGWFKEASVEKMFWDFSANGSIGFSKVWATMRGGLKQSPALTGIHSFARALANSSSATAVQTVLATQSIALPATVYADNETNFGSPAIPNLSPIYLTYGTPGTGIALNSNLGNICVGNSADPSRLYNKAGEFRYVRFTLSTAQAGTRTITVTQSSSTSGGSDPDFVLYNSNGQLLSGLSETNGSETANASLPAGDYVLVISDYGLSGQSSFGTNANACFTLNIR